MYTMTPPTLRLSYDGGTLLVGGADPTLLTRIPHVRHDPRSHQHRAEGRHYRAVAEFLVRERVPFADDARKWDRNAGWELRSDRDPYPHQTEALDVWWKAGGRGVVVLPTGTGKTFLAMLAIQKAARPAFVVTWTIDLLNQWVDQLSRAFRVPVGALGGGNYDLQGITVSTYDSAHLHLERWGDRFGLLVVDECHHLPGPSYQLIGMGALAPYRLGLTATPERSDGQETVLTDLLGPTVYRREIRELSGDFLAEYRTERVYVDLSAEELERYREARDTYRGFVAERGINMGGPQGWQRFLYETTRSPEGRAAFRAYRESKRLERAAAGKLETLEGLLARHAGERTLIFTADNATVYAISRRFLVPALTHQTKAKERQKLLEHFHSGEYSVLVTSQVLNEGVDVPAASVGIVLSGTGTVRENVQRLGRILRRYGDKQAVLYEVVARGTAEEYTSDRRRQHTAFR
jgi:superfamily II DNA or RNA helicase